MACKRIRSASIGRTAATVCLLAAIALGLLMLTVGCNEEPVEVSSGGEGSPVVAAPTDTPAPTVTPRATATPEPPTPAPEPTATPQPSPPTATPTPTPSATALPPPTETPVPTPAATAFPTPTDTPTPMPTPSPTATPVVEAVSVAVAAVPAELPEYKRSDWRHWTDDDGDCQDTRHEVLIAESLADVTFKSDSRCQVLSGEWYGAYVATTVTEASELDVDHLVPLANAHRSGGWSWSSERRERYANSLDDPDHLIAVTRGANRSKGAKGPEEWRPPDESYWCEYATDWIRVKATWELTATPAEVEALRDMLGTCASPPDLTIVQTGAPGGSATATPTPQASRVVYASCDDAERAGERRIQGSRGPGRGYPQMMVPGARDGDGDGVVCEES